MDLIKWFGEVGIDDVDQMGGKNAPLGEMYQELNDTGVRVPNGFAATADAYRQYLLLGADGLARVGGSAMLWSVTVRTLHHHGRPCCSYQP